MYYLLVKCLHRFTINYDFIADEAHWKTPLSLHLHGFLIAFAGMCQRFSDLNWKLDACLVRCRSGAAMITELLIAVLLGTC